MESKQIVERAKRESETSASTSRKISVYYMRNHKSKPNKYKTNRYELPLPPPHPYPSTSPRLA